MIKLDWTIFIQFVNFFLLMGVLNVLLYRPVRGLLRRRREAIDGGHAQARNLEAQIQEKMSQYQARLQEAKIKGNQEKATLRQAAVQEEAGLLAAAQQEAGEQLKTIKSRISAEKEAAAQTLRAEAETLASQVATRVLGRSL